MKARTRARSPHMLPAGLPLYTVLPEQGAGYPWFLWDSRATEENCDDLVKPRQGFAVTREAAHAAALALAPKAERINADYARLCRDGKRPGWGHCVSKQPALPVVSRLPVAPRRDLRPDGDATTRTLYQAVDSFNWPGDMNAVQAAEVVRTLRLENEACENPTPLPVKYWLMRLACLAKAPTEARLRAFAQAALATGTPVRVANVIDMREWLNERARNAARA